MSGLSRFDPLKLTAQPALSRQAISGLRPWERATPGGAAILIQQMQVPDDAAPGPRRSKIWELSANLHCSIIGTCLSTSELRQILTKVKLAPPEASDHDLHGRGVGLAGRRDGAAKILNKALDQRHRPAIKQFDAAASDDEIRTLWRAAVQRGEIPGAYWAALSHPAISNGLAREIFGDVHMLSHLVGAANRADIRRLCELERDKTALEDKVARQQAQLRDAIVERDARIDALGRALAKSLADDRASVVDAKTGAPETAALERLVADLERRLAAEARRRERVEERLDAAEVKLTAESEQRRVAEATAATLEDELAALERGFMAEADETAADAETAIDLTGRAVLYVGGRPNQVAHLRAHGERCGADFMHHDGGIDDRGGLLAGLVSRADLVLFPVDCISHDAALTVKRLCRQAGKPFVPLRSAGVTSFLAALGRARFAAPGRAPGPTQNPMRQLHHDAADAPHRFRQHGLDRPGQDPAA